MPQQTTAMEDAPSGLTPHFVLVPFFAAGHMIPMVDIAYLLAARGVAVTIVMTPHNAARIRAAIDSAEALGLPVRLAVLEFPCEELGLPEGCENLDLTRSLDVGVKFFHVLSSLKALLIEYLRRQRPELRPSCLISDMCMPWTREVADEFGVPRLIFHGTSSFPLLCHHNLQLHKVYDNLHDDATPFLVPGIPHLIEITKEQMPGFFNPPGFEKFRANIIAAEETSDGVVLNSFYELESLYVDSYRKVTGKKAWTIGPVCLYNIRDVADRAARGNWPSVDSSRCLSWLDAMKPGTVVYVSFGSLTTITPPQIVEIGMGLEAAGHPWIWVIKASELSAEVEEWLLEGFEERTRERSLIIRGWAPQMAILCHPAVGGFVSHCGWNSSVEGIAAGVPIVTWPHFAEQFLNERLIVDVLEIGVPVGVKAVTKWKSEGEDGKVVKREAVEGAVRKLMDEGEDGRERRERARVLGEKARKAMDVGGSSYESMTRLIEEMSSHHGSNCSKTSDEEKTRHGPRA